MASERETVRCEEVGIPNFSAEMWKARKSNDRLSHGTESRRVEDE